MGRCHICLRVAAAATAEILPTLTHGRPWPRSIPFTSYAAHAADRRSPGVRRGAVQPVPRPAGRR